MLFLQQRIGFVFYSEGVSDFWMHCCSRAMCRSRLVTVTHRDTNTLHALTLQHTTDVSAEWINRIDFLLPLIVFVFNSRLQLPDLWFQNAPARRRLISILIFLIARCFLGVLSECLAEQLQTKHLPCCVVSKSIKHLKCQTLNNQLIIRV